jgi:molecular chaperone DnaK (HSP70)
VGSIRKSSFHTSWYFQCDSLLNNRKYQLNVTESKKAVVKLRSECERIVQVLSSTASTMASIESLMEGELLPK